MGGISVPTDAYATIEEVRQLLPSRTYDANSKPTLEMAEQIVKDVAVQINGVLRGLGYSTPLSGTDDKKLLGSINRLGAAAMIEAATMVAVQGRSEIALMYQQRFDDMMDDLGKGKYKFATAGFPPALQPDGPDDLDTGGDREDPIFSISEDSMERKF